MRNWFILFTTTFTITTLILAIATSLFNMEAFNSQYVLLLAIISALLSLFMNMHNKIIIENVFLNALLDIIVIFIIVFTTSIIMGLHQVDFINIVISLSLVIIIYIIITLIYLFILTKEAEDMNKKISEWRNKHVDR